MDWFYFAPEVSYNIADSSCASSKDAQQQDLSTLAERTLLSEQLKQSMPREEISNILAYCMCNIFILIALTLDTQMGERTRLQLSKWP